MTYKELDDLLYSIEEGMKLDDAIDILSGAGSLRFVDEKIDDGIEDDEDDYLMMRSYDLTVGNDVIYIRLYYGNNSKKIGYVDGDKEIEW